MVKEKKPYKDNRKLHPEVYSKYCSHASMCKEPNDHLYLDTQDLLKVEKVDNKFASYFARITIKPKVRVWCPIRTKQAIEGEICDSRLVKRDGHFNLHLNVSKNVDFNSNPLNILSVDLGEKVIATAVLLAHDSHSLTSKQSIGKPIFMGRKVRGLRRRYAYLRKKLGERKLQKVIKRIGRTEYRKVNDILHKVSRQLVNIAKQNNAVILLGDLTGIRDRAKGRRMNRIVANMPFYKLTQYITYKANWDNIPVLTTKEWYSSVTCSKCKSDNTKRPHQGLFICNACGYQCNADYNGCKNIGNRLLEYIFRSGVVSVTQPETSAFFRTEEASRLNGR